MAASQVVAADGSYLASSPVGSDTVPRVHSTRSLRLSPGGGADSRRVVQETKGGTFRQEDHSAHLVHPGQHPEGSLRGFDIETTQLESLSHSGQVKQHRDRDRSTVYLHTQTQEKGAILVRKEGSTTHQSKDSGKIG